MRPAANSDLTSHKRFPRPLRLPALLPETNGSTLAVELEGAVELERLEFGFGSADVLAASAR